MSSHIVNIVTNQVKLFRNRSRDRQEQGPQNSWVNKLISPHGSKELKVLLLEGKEKQEELKRAETLPKLQVSSRETGDLIMLGIGGFTPLEGFMGHDDWKGVCEEHEDDERHLLAHSDHDVAG